MTFDEAMMEFHDASMSDDPQVAANGRVFKHVYPALNDALNMERDRGTDPSNVLSACVYLALSIIHFSANRMTKDVASMHYVLKRLQPYIIGRLDESIAQLDEKGTA